MDDLKKYNKFTLDSVSYCDYYWMKNKIYRYQRKKIKYENIQYTFDLMCDSRQQLSDSVFNCDS